MKANEAPKKLYLIQHGGLICYCRNNNDDIEYIRTDAFIERAAEFLYNYNQKQVLKHGARATLGYGEYTINVDEFRKYMVGE